MEYFFQIKNKIINNKIYKSISHKIFQNSPEKIVLL